MTATATATATATPRRDCDDNDGREGGRAVEDQRECGKKPTVKKRRVYEKRAKIEADRCWAARRTYE